MPARPRPSPRVRRRPLVVRAAKLPITSASCAGVMFVHGAVATMAPVRRRCRSRPRAGSRLPYVFGHSAGTAPAASPARRPAPAALWRTVQRAQMSHALFAERAADDVHDIMRRGAGRLGDQDQATVGQSSVSFSFFNTRSMCCACSSPRSRWKCSSDSSAGSVPSRAAPAESARRSPILERRRLLLIGAHDTHAHVRVRQIGRDLDAGDRDEPDPGSRTSPVRNTPTAWRITSLRRSGR